MSKPFARKGGTSKYNELVPALDEDGTPFKPYKTRALKDGKYVVYLFECIPLDKVYVGLSLAWSPAPHRQLIQILSFKDKQNDYAHNTLGTLASDFLTLGPEQFSCTVMSGCYNKEEARDVKHWLTSSVVPNEFLYNKHKRGFESEWMF